MRSKKRSKKLWNNPWAKTDAAERAAAIIERAAKKREIQGLLTPGQEELRKELGLTPEGFEKTAAGKPVKKVKDPLTKRQRALMKELGLEKQEKQEQQEKQDDQEA
jgi:hypothetical protein